MNGQDEAGDRSIRWQRLDELFAEGRLVPEQERPAWLDRACAGDAALYAELESLLAHASDDELLLPHLAAIVAGSSKPGFPEADDEPMIGRVLREYVIEARLGGGGMGVVYRARDRTLDRPVALKFVSRSLVRDETARRRFLSEARAAAAIDHPNICAVYQVGVTEDGSPFLAMPCYDGETLREKISRGRLPVDVAVRHALGVAAGLGAAHARGVIHRDVKPGNILITSDGVAKVLDFGVAKRADAPLTGTGGTVGTAAYMSPEQLRAEAVDARTDLWSLGVVLYECLASRSPFHRESEAATIQAILFEEPSPLLTSRPDLPAAVAAVVERALAKDRSERFADANEFADALRRAEGEAATPLPSRGQRRFTGAAKRRVARGVGLGGVVVLTMVAGGYALWNLVGGRTADGPPVLIAAAGPDAISSQTARELTRRFNRWEPAPARFAELVSARAGDGGAAHALSLAGSSMAATVVLVEADPRADSLRVVADVHDAATGRILRSIATTIRSVDWASLDEIVYAVLELDGNPEELAMLQRQSTRTAAVRAVLEGRRHLEHAEVRIAEQRFRDAIAADSTFAGAHHGHALALYWATAQSWNPNRFGLASRVGRSAAAAVRHARAVSTEEAEHYRAFDRFQAGEYDAARAGYHRLIARDSSDVFAWLGLGLVEATDPWAVHAPDGSLRPRGDRMLAVMAFAEAVGRKPGFLLGYGHLFDVYLALASGIAGGYCEPFERPRERTIRPWERRIASEQIFFCPDYTAGVLEWTLASADRRRDPLAARAVADTLMDIVREEAQRWEYAAPEAARPHEVRADWWLARRMGVPRAPDHAAADSFALEAQREVERALELRGDTIPDDLVRLGSLQLASGDPARALATTREAVKRAGDRFEAGEWLMPIAAANAFLAAGEADDAIRIVEANWTRWFSMAVPDPLESRSLHVADAPPILARIHVLGAIGRRDGLREAFQALDRVFGEAGLSPRQTVLLRRWATPYVAPALALDDELREAWFRGWDSLPPPWSVFAAADRKAADAQPALDAHVRTLRAPQPTALYVAAVLAQKLGRHALAAELFERMDEAVLAVDNVDPGWGLRALSLALRTRSSESMTQYGLAAQARPTVALTAAWCRRIATVPRNSGGARPVCVECDLRNESDAHVPRVRVLVTGVVDDDRRRRDAEGIRLRLDVQRAVHDGDRDTLEVQPAAPGQAHLLLVASTGRRVPADDGPISTLLAVRHRDSPRQGGS